MRTFARIINLPETQCLITVKYDNESDEDHYKTSFEFDLGSVIGQLGVSFDSKEKAIQCMEEYTDAQAQSLLDTLRKLLTGVEGENLQPAGSDGTSIEGETACNTDMSADPERV